MGKSFKSRKKARNSKAPPRLDSAAPVVLPVESERVSNEPAETIETSAEQSAVESEPAKIETLPEPKIEAKPEEKAEAKPEEKIEAKPEPKKVEAKSEPKITKSADAVEGRAAESKKDADVSGEFKGFFSKPEEEIHLEEARREAPDLHEDAVVAKPRRHVDRRAHQIVIGVVGFAAAIGIAGAVMRRATPRASAATATAVAAQPILPPKAPEPAAPPPPPPPVVAPAPPPPPPAPVETAAAAPTPTPTPGPAPVESAAPAPTTTAAPAATTAAVVASAAAAPTAPAADEEDSLSGAQLLSKARQAINSGAASKAANYAKKAIAKGAGGSAYYVLGAAYQTMGSNGAAKSAYGNCAKSGCAEAGECASLAEGL